MRIVVAPDSFKGSVSAREVADAMERGIIDVFPAGRVIKVPVADGGEGTVSALVDATGGVYCRQNVTGPLGGPVEACWGILGDGKTAVIEMAAASGLALVAPDKRDPGKTTTYGTGELIQAALDKGLRRLIIGIGGSATNDGGVGVISALGGRFLADDGSELPFGGAALAGLDRIDLSGLDPRLAQAEIRVACDVKNPLLGPSGATIIYGPQKGADQKTVAGLEAAMANYCAIASRETCKDVASAPGAGAAGGLGAGLLFFTQARLVPGIEIVAEAAGLDAKIAEADLVLTGEGRADGQTVFGKVPAGIAQIAAKHNVPVICIAGGLGSGYRSLYSHGIDGFMAIQPQPMALEECMASAPSLIGDAVSRALRLVAVGMKLTRKAQKIKPGNNPGNKTDL